MSDDHSPNWNVIVERHAERVFRIAYRILGSVHDAEDVSQIVFTEALRVQADGPVQSWTGLFCSTCDDASDRPFKTPSQNAIHCRR